MPLRVIFELNHLKNLGTKPLVKSVKVQNSAIFNMYENSEILHVKINRKTSVNQVQTKKKSVRKQSLVQ